MKKRLKWLLGCVLVCALICVLIVITLRVLKPAYQYRQAEELMERGEYRNAISVLTGLGEYRDGGELLEACYRQVCGEETYEMLQSLQVGDSFFYGSYEQDGDLSNASEPVEWIVLNKEGTELFLVSRYGLDCQPYYNSYTEVTWEASTLREWLNSTFWEDAFSPREQSAIVAKEVSADLNTMYEGTTDPGAATEDHVFLLSAPEAEEYLSESDRTCFPTEYALSQGVLATGENGECKWWTRTPGRRQYDVSTVLPTGFIDGYGDGAHVTIIAVRPAIRIDLSRLPQ